MKTSLLIIFSFISMEMLTSCSKEDTYYYSHERTLYGGSSKTWKITKLEMNGLKALDCRMDDLLHFNLIKNYFLIME